MPGRYKSGEKRASVAGLIFQEDFASNPRIPRYRTNYWQQRMNWRQDADSSIRGGGSLANRRRESLGAQSEGDGALQSIGSGYGCVWRTP
jgi:hypothetical protein